MFQVLMLVLPVLGAALAPSGAEDLTGTWDVAAKFSIVGGPGDGQKMDMKAEFHLVQRGTELNGTFVPYEDDGKTPQPSVPLRDGLVTGTKVTFRLKQRADSDTALVFTLVLADGHLRGDAVPSKEVTGGGKLTIKVDATRRK